MLDILKFDSVEGSYTITPLGYVLFIALLIIILGFTSVSFSKEKKRQFSTKQLVFSSMAVALAFLTSNIKIIDMPSGGSVTLLSMLFICLVGYFYGPRIGLTSAFAYGILQMIVNPYIVSLPQMFMDYLFAFTALGLSGLTYKLQNGLIVGYVIGVVGRMIFSVLSGVLFFADYAPENMNVLLFSFTYNGIYLGAEAVLTVLIIIIPAVSKALSRVKALSKG